MAIPLLLSAANFLGGATKKAMSPNTKNTAVVEKDGKGEGDKSGAIVKSEQVSITPTSPMVGSGVASTSATPTKVSKSTGKVSFSSINNQLDSMVALTSMIDTVTQKQTEGQKKVAEASRKKKEKEKKKDREEKSESGGALGFLGSKAKEAGNKFGIFNFLTSILLGVGALALIDLTKKLSKGFDGLGDVFGGITQGFKLFGLTIAAVAKEFPTILTKTKNLFSKIKFGDKLKKLGTGFKNVFGRLGKKLIPGFISKITDAVKAIRGGFNTVKNLGRAGLEAVRRGLTFDTRTKVPTTTNKGLNRLLGSGSGTGTKSIGVTKAVQSIRTKHGDEAARMYQGLVDNGAKPQRALQNVNKAISSGKLASVPMKGSLAGGVKGSQLVKGGVKQTLKRTSIKLLGKSMTKFLGRVPVVGSLLVGIFTLLEDEDGDGKPDFNLAKGTLALIGAGIGGAIGTGIMPVVGTVIGEMIGEYIGRLFYTAISGGGLEAIKKQLANDIKGALTAGKVALGWIGDGFKRMYEGLPKLNVGFGEIVNFPALMINPLQIAPIVGKAFFTRDSMEEGEVKEADQQDLTNASGQTGVMSEQAKQIAEGKYYESSGMYYDSVTHQYVGATEEEARAKLGVNVSPSSTGSSIVQKVPLANLQNIGVGSGAVGKTSNRGMRGGRHHAGIDIGTSGQKGYYVAFKMKGKVDLVKSLDGYGKTVIINVGDLDFLFAHLASYSVKQGEVYDGQIIGEIGNTGVGSGEHLHFEVRTKGGGSGTDVDPEPYIKYLEIGKKGAADITKSTPEVDLKPTTPEPKREDFGSGRSGGKNYEKALASYKSEMQSQPEISPQTSPSASVSGVESQASYEQTGGGSTVVLAAPPQQSSGGGGGSSGGGSVMRVGSGDVLNSYYRAQLLGFLYKQG